MLKKIILTICFLCTTTVSIHAQKETSLKAVNQVWEKFYDAFANLDVTLMADIHSKNLIRISGGNRILDYDSYINNYKRQFASNKANQRTNHIALRFFERLHDESIASERGVYRLTINKGKENEQHYYGQFHVILVKENKVWKILMDYDSTEFDTIGKEAFDKAYSITDFDKFLN
ncbi:MAG: nuclear transport factor 2 family protein [Algicola sp.]|nr:nuclear transport factor 2 family protein [Algicola sp.]